MSKAIHVLYAKVKEDSQKELICQALNWMWVQ